MPRQDTKFRLGSAHFKVPSLPKQLANCNGLIPIPVIIELIVGEEIGLYWMDRTPFIHDLGAVRPFKLRLKSGLFSSNSGPLIWLLFYVPGTGGSLQPFASTECYINPSDSQQVETWRKLANQTHWHLTLIGDNDCVVDLFEFENDFHLDVALERMKSACHGMRVTDFVSATVEFSNSYSMQDLYTMT